MNDTTSEANELAALGIRVFPCRPLDKRPTIKDWPNQATSTPSEGWFDGRNIGVRCGATDLDGVEFFVVDIDIKDDAPGEQSWADFCDEHPEVREAAEATVSVTTPSGGWHFWFVVPEGSKCPSNGRPWPGVDIRGEGGYVLAPTSGLTNGPYTWVRDPWENEVLEAPAALIEALVPRETPAGSGLPPHEGEVRSTRPVPQHNTPTPSRLIHDDDPKEWAKQNFSVYDWLMREGWQAGRRKGNEEVVTRPGKSPRDGGSATMHHDSNIVNIYTTTLDPFLERVGHRNSNGTYTINGFDAWMIENGYTSASEAMKELRRNVMPQSREPELDISALVPSSGSTVHEADEGVQSASANLPDEFWSSRDWLAHIRTAAHSRMASADAILGAILARYSATIPVTYRIPPIVMSASTFDHMSVLVSESSGGKSGAAAIARELLPPKFDKVIRWDQPVGSGEGLVELFYDWITEENDKGKMVEVHKKVFNAVHFTADEGMALVQTSRRDSTTIGSVLCSAWSGTQLGQANASRDRKRIVEAGTGRVAGVCGIQLSLGHYFLSDEWVRQGLSGRLVFFAAEDPSIPHPEDKPAWPGPLTVEYHPIVPLEIEYAQEIINEIQEDHWTRTTGKRHEAPIDGHTRLAKLKISGMIALIEGRQNVTTDDWALANTIMLSSISMRDRMLLIKQQIERDEGHKRVEAKVYYEEVGDRARHRRRVDQCKEAIVRALARHGALQRKEIKNKLDRTLVRDGVLSDALNELAVAGVIHKPKRGETGGFHLL